MRLRKAGHRVVYDPMVVIQHVEFGSATSSRSARMIQRNHRIFVEKHRDWLRYKHPRGRGTPCPRGRRRRAAPASCSSRTASRCASSARATCARTTSCTRWRRSATMSASIRSIPPPPAIMRRLADFPETVEVLYDRGLEQLPRLHRGALAATTTSSGSAARTTWSGCCRSWATPRRRCPSTARARHRGDRAPRTAEQRPGAGPPTQGRPRHDAARRARLRLFLPEDRRRERARRRPDPAGRAQQRRRARPHAGAGTDAGGLVRSVPACCSWARFTRRTAPTTTASPGSSTQVLPRLDGRLPPEVRFTVAGYAARRVDMSPFGAQRRGST